MTADMAAQMNSHDDTLNLVFACAVCGDKFTDIYEDHNQTVEGLSDGINKRNRLVTLLYVASCSHVICIKHIGDGNGPAFHPAGKRPSAPCPVCVNEGSGDEPRDLFSVRGFKPGEYDPAIPKDWFIAYPNRMLPFLDKDSGAIRFQYLSLLRYSQNANQVVRRLQSDLASTRTKLLLVSASPDHDKIRRLEEEIERLRPFEEEAHRLRSYVPAVNFYLDSMPQLLEERYLMKERLDNSGIGMTLKPLPPLPEDMIIDESGRFAGPGSMEAAPEVPPEISPPSQLRLPKRDHGRSSIKDKGKDRAPSSADLMPPPQKPLSRILSLRKTIPEKLRGKFQSKSLKVRQDIYIHRAPPLVSVDNLSATETAEGSVRQQDWRTTDDLDPDNDIVTGVQDPRDVELGQVAKRQRSNVFSSHAYRTHPDALRSQPAHVFVNEPNRTNGPDPATAGPSSSQQLTGEPHRTVSSYFRQTNRVSHPILENTYAERQNSYDQSATFQSQRSLSQTRACSWDEEPGLNGLAFFSSPMNRKPSPINRKRQTSTHLHTTTLQNPRLRNLDSRGFITKPNLDRTRRQLNSQSTSPYRFSSLPPRPGVRSGQHPPTRLRPVRR